jgi:predicted RNA binding protein YcfA (HicA-like mRNA interferase family)
LTKLPRLTGKEVARIVEKFGFVHCHTAGSHTVYRHSDGRKTVIPVHAGEEIGPGLLNKIIKKDLGITRDEFLSKT